MLNYQELYDNEQLLISENKLLEVFYFIFFKFHNYFTHFLKIGTH
jgi:hypothetical protein